jgi:hypothetical protein
LKDSFGAARIASAKAALLSSSRITVHGTITR